MPNCKESQSANDKAFIDCIGKIQRDVTGGRVSKRFRKRRKTMNKNKSIKRKSIKNKHK